MSQKGKYQIVDGHIQQLEHVGTVDCSICGSLANVYENSIYREEDCKICGSIKKENKNDKS